jgi:hypothetical protein
MKKRAVEEVLFETAATGDLGAAIRNQEARGQQDLIFNDVLPKKCIYCDREQLEQMGIVFGEPVDELFIEAKLPEGWKKKPLEHSMWSELVDDKGRTRARIFYKAAFYDREAHIGIVPRFVCTTEPVCGYEADWEEVQESDIHAVVKDCGKIVWKSKPVAPSPEAGSTREDWDAFDERKKRILDEARSWLGEHYPNWEDPLEHWS